MLRISSLSHFYGKQRVLDDVSLQVKQAERGVLLGASGCGKSTLLRLVAGLETIKNSGRKASITIGDDEVFNASHTKSPDQRAVAMVFQQPSLFPHANVLDNITLGLTHGRTRLSKADAKALAYTQLEAVGLKEKADDYPSTLSGGQQQRVALARALVLAPQLLLLDEPFANLDPVLRHEMGSMTRELLSSQSITTLLVTHDAQEAMVFADALYVMEVGRVIQSGGSQAIYQQPFTHAIAAFFGALSSYRMENHPFGSSVKHANAKTVAIRPEHVSLTDAGEVALSGQVVAHEIRGATGTIDVQLENTELHIQATDLTQRLPEIGQHVTLGIYHKDLLFFDDEKTKNG